MNDYDSFLDEIKDLCEELWSLAKQKLKEEDDAMDQLAAGNMLSMGPLLVIAGYGIYNNDTLGNEEGCDYEGTREKVVGFAEDYCFDYSSVEDAINGLDVAIEKFDISAAHTDISSNLGAAWPESTNKSAKLFKENYVAPIIDIWGDQYSALVLAKDDLNGVPKMVENNREALKEAIQDTTSQLSKYVPAKHLALTTFQLSLFAWGLTTADPVTGRVSSIADLIITAHKSKLLEVDVGLTADYFKALRDAVDAGTKSTKKVIKSFGETVDKTVSELEENHKRYIVKRPG